MIKWTDNPRWPRRRRRNTTPTPVQPPAPTWEPQSPSAEPAPVYPQFRPVNPPGGHVVDAVTELEAIAYATGVLRDPWGDAR